MMNKQSFCIIILLFFSPKVFSQSPKYFEIRHLADSLICKKEYSLAGDAYRDLLGCCSTYFTINDYYNAASVYAEIGKADMAFHFLQPLAFKMKYDYLDDFNIGKEWGNLKNDKRWVSFIAKVKSNSQLSAKHYNLKLKRELEEIYIKDQKYRLPLDSTISKYGADSKQVNELWRRMEIADRQNLQKIRSILDVHGWLSTNVVGRRAATAQFIVIQHADDYPVIQIKYAEMFRKAILAGTNDQKDNYAYLQDRILVNQNKPQIYGTQLKRGKDNKYAPFPIKDSINVDKKRLEVGLEPLKYSLQLSDQYSKVK